MTRRIPSAVLVALGILVIVLAVLSATVWRPDDRATLSLPSSPEQPLVISDPGVLDAVADEVTITASADSDQPVVIAVGRSADVEAWVGETPALRITGLSSWEELAVEEHEAADGATEEGADDAAEAASPAGSDLWLTEATGTGEAELEWQHRDGRWSLIAATDGAAPAPEISLTWPVEARTPWLIPGIIVGALLVLVGLGILLLDVLARREAQRRRVAAEQRAAARAGADASETAVLTAVDAAPAPTTGLTRRQLRERARAEQAEAERARRRRRGGTRPEPMVAGATAEAPTAVTPTAGAPAAAAAPVAADGHSEALVQAGPARGAGIVPAVPDATRYRTARVDEAEGDEAAPPETDTTAGEKPAPAGAQRTDDAETAAKDTSQDPPPRGHPDEGTSQWRSLWAFTGASGREATRADDERRGGEISEDDEQRSRQIPAEEQTRTPDEEANR